MNRLKGKVAISEDIDLGVIKDSVQGLFINLAIHRK
jgi:hypothetical protein